MSRRILKQFENKKVVLVGKAGCFVDRRVCLTEVKVYKGTTAFSYVGKFDHIWIPSRRVKDKIHKGLIGFVAGIYSYERSNGSISYGASVLKPEIDITRYL